MYRIFRQIPDFAKVLVCPTNLPQNPTSGVHSEEGSNEESTLENTLFGIPYV